MNRSDQQLANDAWESLLTAHAEMMRELVADDIWDELTMREYDVIYTLSKCERPQRLADLNRHVLLSQPALSRLVERLITRGLIVRQRDRSGPGESGVGVAGWGADGGASGGVGDDGTVVGPSRGLFGTASNDRRPQPSEFGISEPGVERS